MGKASIKASMRCGEVRRSTLPGKKVMKKYCNNGKETLVHAGVAGTKQNPDAKTRAAFRARHGCASAKTATPKHLACETLWGNHSSPKERKLQN